MVASTFSVSKTQSPEYQAVLASISTLLIQETVRQDFSCDFF